MTKKNVMLMGIHGRIGEHLYLELELLIFLLSYCLNHLQIMQNYFLDLH